VPKSQDVRKLKYLGEYLPMVCHHFFLLKMPAYINFLKTYPIQGSRNQKNLDLGQYQKLTGYWLIVLSFVTVVGMYHHGTSNFKKTDW